MHINTQIVSHIFFHPDFNRWSRSFTGSANMGHTFGRGLYRQWGITPRPEDILSSCSATLYATAAKKATPRLKFSKV